MHAWPAIDVSNLGALEISFTKPRRDLQHGVRSGEFILSEGRTMSQVSSRIAIELRKQVKVNNLKCQKLW